jgi:hypothetical protein
VGVQSSPWSRLRRSGPAEKIQRGRRGHGSRPCARALSLPTWMAKTEPGRASARPSAGRRPRCRRRVDIPHLVEKNCSQFCRGHALRLAIRLYTANTSTRTFFVGCPDRKPCVRSRGERRNAAGRASEETSSCPRPFPQSAPAECPRIFLFPCTVTVTSFPAIPFRTVSALTRTRDPQCVRLLRNPSGQGAFQERRRAYRPPHPSDTRKQGIHLSLPM